MQVKRVVTGELEENCYILINDDKCLVIDPGDDYFKIKKELGSLNVEGVLITHEHFDHIGALDELLKDYDVVVYSKDNLKEGITNISDFIFEVIYTPGHTIDSVTYYFKKDKMMFTGDFLFKNNIGRCDLPTGDFDMMKKSLSKIKKYKTDTVIYPGHGEDSTLDYEFNNNYYLFTN